MRVATHDRVAETTNSILRYANYRTKWAEKNCFIGADPDNRKVPDISVLNYGQADKKLLLDVTIPATLRYTNQGIAVRVNPKDLGKQAEAASKIKIQKYEDACAANGHIFQPIVLESCGYVHPNSLTFFKLLATRCAPLKKIPSSALYAYFMKRLSVSLQKGLAENIIDKLHMIHYATYPNIAFSDNDVFRAI